MKARETKRKTAIFKQQEALRLQVHIRHIFKEWGAAWVPVATPHTIPSLPLILIRVRCDRLPLMHSLDSLERLRSWTSVAG